MWPYLQAEDDLESEWFSSYLRRKIGILRFTSVVPQVLMPNPYNDVQRSEILSYAREYEAAEKGEGFTHPLLGSISNDRLLEYEKRGFVEGGAQPEREDVGEDLQREGEPLNVNVGEKKEQKADLYFKV